MSLFRYSAAFIDWTKEEISEIDRGTRKLLTMYKVHHPKAMYNGRTSKEKKEAEDLSA